jgi:hypothetical protein
VHFEEVECFPKPVQDPMPIYAGGNHPEVRRRAGRTARGARDHDAAIFEGLAECFEHTLGELRQLVERRPARLR